MPMKGDNVGGDRSLARVTIRRNISPPLRSFLSPPHSRTSVWQISSTEDVGWRRMPETRPLSSPPQRQISLEPSTTDSAHDSRAKGHVARNANQQEMMCRAMRCRSRSVPREINRQHKLWVYAAVAQLGDVALGGWNLARTIEHPQAAANRLESLMPQKGAAVDSVVDVTQSRHQRNEGQPSAGTSRRPRLCASVCVSNTATAVRSFGCGLQAQERAT